MKKNDLILFLIEFFVVLCVGGIIAVVLLNSPQPYLSKEFIKKGDYYLKKGDTERALYFYQSYLDLNPSDVAVQEKIESLKNIKNK